MKTELIYKGKCIKSLKSVERYNVRDVLRIRFIKYIVTSCRVDFAPCGPSHSTVELCRFNDYMNTLRIPN